jgi:GDP-L-fucose synthase
MIGASIAAALLRQGYENIVLRGADELDLSDEAAVDRFFFDARPEYVFCFAGPHGGIIRNTTYPADLIYTNLKTQCAIIHSAYKHGVKKLLFMVGNCAYPKESPQPISEGCFMAGKMEPTSAAYSTARAAGIEMCWAYDRQYKTNFVPAVLANYYGVGDDFSDDGHVLASILRKMCDARERGDDAVTLWGTGEPQRQFMYVDDMADAAVLIMEKYDNTELINIAGGAECSISDLAGMLKELTGYKGQVVFDSTKPNGTMRKCMDDSKLKALGFAEKISFRQGLELIYEDYCGQTDTR